MSAETDARPADLHSKPLPFPKTERQAEFMALADRLAAFAAERAPSTTARARSRTRRSTSFGRAATWR